MKKMTDLFKVGEWFYGYFGRGDYKTKQCVFVTPNYGVFEYHDDETAIVLNKEDCFNLNREMVEKWTIGGTK